MSCLLLLAGIYFGDLKNEFHFLKKPSLVNVKSKTEILSIFSGFLETVNFIPMPMCFHKKIHRVLKLGL